MCPPPSRAAPPPQQHTLYVVRCKAILTRFSAPCPQVEEAVHDFRAFVHSDCGGHGHCKVNGTFPAGQPPPPPEEDEPCHDPSTGVVLPTTETLLRWTAHCVFGTVVRSHAGSFRSVRRKPMFVRPGTKTAGRCHYLWVFDE